MNTKHYEFTYEEILVLRDAVIEYKHLLGQQNTEQSPIARRMRILAIGLAEQFKQDARLSK